MIASVEYIYKYAHFYTPSSALISTNTQFVEQMRQADMGLGRKHHKVGPS